MKQTLSLRIMAPDAIAYEGEVVSITAENTEGLFDILPDHTRFMSLIHPTPVTIGLPEGGQKSVSFENALLFFEDNNATIYVQEPASKIAL